MVKGLYKEFLLSFLKQNLGKYNIGGEIDDNNRWSKKNK